MAVKGHETARKQFRHGPARRKPGQHIPVPMLENEDPRQRRALRRRIRRFPMPWRPIHTHLEAFFSPGILNGLTGPRSGAVTEAENPFLLSRGRTRARRFHTRLVHLAANLVPPNNNSIVAQNLDVLARSPQPRRRT